MANRTNPKKNQYIAFFAADETAAVIEKYQQQVQAKTGARISRSEAIRSLLRLAQDHIDE